MKNNLDRYPHSVTSHSHWKFKTLRRAYGWAGEGKFWALNNMIADAGDCVINLNDPVRKAAVAAEIDFDVPELEEYICFLAEKCQLIVNNNGLITTEKVQETFSFVDEKRVRDRNRKIENSTRKTDFSAWKVEDSTRKTENSNGVAVEKEQSKVKESKVKESKENNTGATTSPPPAKKKFIEPSLEEIRGYMTELMGDAKNPQYWPEDKIRDQAATCIDHYTANGWVQAKGKAIKDWKAAVRNWIRREMKGVFSPPPVKFIAQEQKPQNTIAPRVESTNDKIAKEVEYLYERFLENEVTVISVDTVHYNFLKSSGQINFSDEKVAEIKQAAVNHFSEKNITPTEGQLISMMKKMGVIEFFKQKLDNAKMDRKAGAAVA